MAHEKTDFQTYGEWLKSQQCFISFDRNKRRHKWLVMPYSYCPNVADLVDESNWQAIQTALAEADPSGEEYELQSFSSWVTPYERYIVAPKSAALAAAQLIMQRLENYPILNEEDLGERENAAQYQSVVDELRSLTLERNGEILTTEQESDLANEICSNANDSETYSAEQVKAALGKLGWVECVDEIWRPVWNHSTRTSHD